MPVATLPFLRIGWDSNPREPFQAPDAFKAPALNRSATHPLALPSLALLVLPLLVATRVLLNGVFVVAPDADCRWALEAQPHVVVASRRDARRGT